MVTSGVGFSFDDIMYRQGDGVAVESPLGLLLAHIFVGYCESLIMITSILRLTFIVVLLMIALRTVWISVR